MSVSGLKLLIFTFAFTVSVSAIAGSGPSREQTIDYIEMMRMKYGRDSIFSIKEDRKYLRFERITYGDNIKTQMEVANVEKVILAATTGSYIVKLKCRRFTKCFTHLSDYGDSQYDQEKLFEILPLSNESEALARKVAKAYIHLFKFYGVELILEDKIVKEDLF
ncbi:hypothetical protein [Amphritea sp.]|uniref:hypothetical protein n=1 Tax=Amphritea sp. TaxID=1872502 RepID=UPI0025B8F61C|nr:hypothetical protein [Amphritea sp.]